MSDLTTRLGPLTLRNPVLLASGTAGFGREIAEYLDLASLGGIIVKGTSPEPWLGNPGPRTVETPSGLINSIGLENPGLRHFLDEDLPWLRARGATVIVNVVGRTVEEYVAVADGLAGVEGVAALELNISCPNVKAGGIQFGHDPRLAAEVTRAVKAACGRPLFVKLSPNAPDVLGVAEAVLEAGADGLSLINTYLALAIDVWRMRPVLPGIFGGLSGPAIKPLALRWVWEAHARFKVPVIGMGGIREWSDAAEFLLAGAHAVAVGTASFTDPRTASLVVDGLRKWLDERGFATVGEVVGLAHRAIDREEAWPVGQ